MSSSTLRRPRAGLMALIAAAATVVLLTLTSAARAAELPRAGYWCGFTTAHSLTVTPNLIGESSTPFLNACKVAQTRTIAPSDRRPVSFVIRIQHPHYYLDDLLFGEDSIRYITNAHFGNANPFTASQNGATMTGSFNTSTFFVGTLKHPGGEQRNLYAWFVGRTCGFFSPPFWYGCM